MTKTFVGSGYLDNYHVVVAWSTCASQIFFIFGFSSSATSVICFPNIRNFYSHFSNLAKGPHRNFATHQMDMVRQWLMTMTLAVILHAKYFRCKITSNPCQTESYPRKEKRYLHCDS